MELTVNTFVSGWFISQEFNWAPLVPVGEKSVVFLSWLKGLPGCKIKINQLTPSPSSLPHLPSPLTSLSSHVPPLSRPSPLTSLPSHTPLLSNSSHLTSLPSHTPPISHPPISHPSPLTPLPSQNFPGRSQSSQIGLLCWKRCVLPLRTSGRHNKSLCKCTSSWLKFVAGTVVC